MSTIVKARLKLKNGTSAAWTSANPVLLLGEPGFETDTRVLRIGNGVAAFLSLPGLKLPATGLGDLAVVQVAHMISLSGLTGAPNKGVHFTGAGVMATHDQTVQARVLLAAITQADQRTALGLGLLATASNVGFTDINGAAVRLSGEGFSASDVELPTVSWVRDYVPTVASKPRVWGTVKSMIGLGAVEEVGLPSGIEEIEVDLYRWSLSGTNLTYMQLRVDGVWITTGYDSASTAGGLLNTQGFLILTNTAASLHSATMRIRRFDGQRWKAGHDSHVNAAGYAGHSSVDVGAGTVDGVRVKTESFPTGGHQTFDLGDVKFGYRIGF